MPTLGTNEEEELLAAVVACDSWGDVEDIGDAVRHGRFAVTLFFDNEDQAQEFRRAVDQAILAR